MSLVRAAAFLLVIACLAAQARAQEAFVEQDYVAEGRQPHAVAVPGGPVWLTYAKDRTIWLKRSLDGGKTFEEAMKVAEVPAMDLGMRRGPRVAVADEALVVTCIAGEHARGRDGDLLLWRSEDGGKSWSEPKKLNSVAGSAREGLQATAAAGKYVAVVWLDMRGDGTTLYGSFSEDGGRSFTPDRQLYASPSGTICECCAPQVAVDAGQRVAILFRNALGGARDMYLLKSTDAGKTFSPARKQGEGSWLIDACPMDGGSVTMEGVEISAVWRRQDQLYWTRDNMRDTSTRPAEERPLGAGENASLAPSQSLQLPYAYVTPEGQVMLGHLRGNGRPQEVAARGVDPVAVWISRPQRTLVAWERDGRVFARLLKGE